MLDTLLTILFVTCGILAALVAACHFWEWYYNVPTSQDETGYFRSRDGWRLAVHRYRSREKGAGHPVILCHGLGGNRYSFDLRGAPSLARFLSNHGWDVWVVELRGSGASDRPGVWFSEVPYRWSFEDHLHYDVPAVIEYVLERTGAPAVHWIGHSMGGMLAEAYLAGVNSPSLASATAIGSPADFSKISRPLFDKFLHLKWILRVLPLAPMPYIAKMCIPVIHCLPTSLQSLFYPENIEPHVAKAMVAIGSPMVMASRLWLDFARFLEAGRPTAEDGTPYLTGLGESAVPLLLIAGAKDVMAPPAAVMGTSLLERDVGNAHASSVGENSDVVKTTATWTCWWAGERIPRYTLISLIGFPGTIPLRTREETAMAHLLDRGKATESGGQGTGTGIAKGPGNG